MLESFENKIKKINEYLHGNSWYDFEIAKMESTNLHIIGSTDFYYYYGIEIIFKNVFYMNCNRWWKTDPENDVFVLPTVEEKNNLIYNYQIEKGYDFMIKIIPDEDVKPFFIAFGDLEVNFGSFGYPYK